MANQPQGQWQRGVTEVPWHAGRPVTVLAGDDEGRHSHRASPEPAPPAGPAPDEPAPAAAAEVGPGWRGEFRFTSFEVGDPGAAATVPAFPDPENWDIRDTVLDGVRLRGAGELPSMELRAASARGRSHRYEGTVRQDAYAYRSDGRFVVLAVTDGVSDGPLSHVAANIVSQHGCHMIARQLETTDPEALDWGNILEVLATKVVSAGRRRLSQTRPDADQLEPREIARHLATTALFAVLGMAAVDGFHPVHLLPHGDTSAWILRSGRTWEPQQAVKNNGKDVASSATRALPYFPERAPAAIRARLGPADTLVLMTDGIGDPLGDGAGSVGAFLAEQWQHPPEPLAFAAHVDFARRSHDDDRTAVAVWPAPPA